MILYSPEDIERFRKYLREEAGPLATPCQIWTGAKSRGGGGIHRNWYGSFWLPLGTVRAHKFSFIALGKKPLPPKTPLDHLCERTLCVCDEHLEATTLAINNERRYGNR